MDPSAWLEFFAGVPQKSAIETMFDERINSMSRERDQKIKQELILKLNQLGYDVTDENFEQFAKKRLTLVSGGNDVNAIYQIYLDYVEGKKPGTLLTIYSNKVNVTFESPTSMRATITLG